METKQFNIEIHQSRRYSTALLHYATVTNKNTKKSITDWFKPFNNEQITNLKKLNWRND
ncbi:MAG: hypothetical protein AABY15_04870 [Nanoarchaeota archaeon]